MKYGTSDIRLDVLEPTQVRKAQISIVAFGINTGLTRGEIADLIGMITPTESFTTDLPRLSPAGP